MGLAFLTPAFLLGLLALSVPILIHLYRREKSSIVRFPSLMFLERIPYRSVRQQRIRHWFLLLMRCAALALLAIAFSRPFLEAAAVGEGGTAARRQLVLLVDRSFSMGYGDRWQRALAAARAAVEELGPEDRASIIAFDERAIALNQPTSDPIRLYAVLDGLELSHGVTRLAPALKLARRTLVESDLGGREVLLISDRQRSAWTAGEDVRLPRGTRFRQVDLAVAAASNLAVTSVLLDRSRAGERQRIGVAARLTNRGETGFDDVPVVLELDGREVQSLRFSLDPNSSEMVRFEPITVSGDQLTRGTVRAVGDRLATDNAFHFVLSPSHGVSVLLVRGRGRSRSDDLFLTRALELGHTPFFRVETEVASSLTAADLAGRAVVILNDGLGDLSAAGADALVDFVERGGGLLLALSRAYSGAVPSSLAQRLPLPAAQATSRSGDWGGTLAYLDYSHPVYEIFSAPRSGDFAAAKFFRYHPLPEEQGDSVLSRFDDGEVALLERRVGEGRVLVWASSLDTQWNTLPLQPVFLPFVHQTMKHLATYAVAREWYTVGQVAELDADADATIAAGGGEWLLVAPSGAQETVVLGESRLIHLGEQGFYDARPVGVASGDSEHLVTLAANVDFSESDLGTLDAEELAAAVAPFENEEGQTASGAALPEEKEERQRFWWYLLLGALFLLGLETFLSNRLSPGRAELPAESLGGA